MAIWIQLPKWNNVINLFSGGKWLPCAGSRRENTFGFRLGMPQFESWRTKLLEEAMPNRIFT